MLRLLCGHATVSGKVLITTCRAKCNAPTEVLALYVHGVAKFAPCLRIPRSVNRSTASFQSLIHSAQDIDCE